MLFDKNVNQIGAVSFMDRSLSYGNVVSYGYIAPSICYGIWVEVV